MRTAGVFALVVTLAAAAAAAQARGEFEVKAAYLYNFARFVEWPAAATARDPFTICVLGSDPFGRALDTTVANVSLRGAKVAARRSEPFAAIV